MTRRNLWCVLIVGLVGFLAVGCGGSGGGSSAQGSGVVSPSSTGDPKQDLLAALTRMDQLKTYQGDMTMSMSGMPGGGAMTTTSKIQTDVANNVVYQVTEVSGVGPGPTKQEMLIRGSEMLMRSDLFQQAYGGGADTWYRAPSSGARSQGATLMVSMYFAPAAQAITSVSKDGTKQVGGTEVTVYRAQLDTEKLRAAMASVGAPAAVDAKAMPAPSSIDYGIGPDGYVHSISFDMNGQVTIELHEFDSALSLPNPTDIKDLPTS